MHIIINEFRSGIKFRSVCLNDVRRTEVIIKQSVDGLYFVDSFFQSVQDMLHVKL